MKVVLKMSLLLSLCLSVFAHADIRSAKRNVNMAINNCDSQRATRSLNCLKQEVSSIIEGDYEDASHRNNNRLVCIIDTEYYDDDGDGWGWIPETRESCVVIGQRDTRRRAPQLDNAMDIYQSLKWLNGVSSCFRSTYNQVELYDHNDRTNRRPVKRRRADRSQSRDRNREREKRDRQRENESRSEQAAQAQIDCVSNMVYRGR